MFPKNFEKYLVTIGKCHFLARCKIFVSLDPIDVRDDVDQMIEQMDINALEEIILKGDYWRLEDHLFPANRQNLQNDLNRLMVIIAHIYIFFIFQTRKNSKNTLRK